MNPHTKFFVLAVALFASPSALADSTDQTANAIRATAILAGPSAFGGINYSRWIGRIWGLEGSLAGGSVGNVSGGAYTEILGRVRWIGERHAVTIGAGPALSLSQHGPVRYVRSELAYEYRHPHGFSVIAGYGPLYVVNTSQKYGSCTTWDFFCTTQFAPGLGWAARLAVGYAF